MWRAKDRTLSEKRSGWDSASTGHLVCLVQACVKGLYLYLYLLTNHEATCGVQHGARRSN